MFKPTNELFSVGSCFILCHNSIKTDDNEKKNQKEKAGLNEQQL